MEQEEAMNVSKTVRERAMAMPRVDTHCHFGLNFPDLDETAAKFDDFAVQREMTSSRIHAIGCRELYGIDPGTFLRPDSPPEIFERARHFRADGPVKALERAMDAAAITTQICFTGHFLERDELLPELAPLGDRVRVLAYVDDTVAGWDLAFTPDGYDPEFNYYDALSRHFGGLATFDEHLEALDATIDGWRGYGVIGMKTALAYTLGLRFGDPSLAEARTAFARKRDMTPEDVATVQHYAFRHALLACKRNEFPVVIHTGIVGTHVDLRQTNPMQLQNILADSRYEDITFILLHGGNPYAGEATYLAWAYPNVMIDFTWFSWMTQARFRMALSEWIEVVPHGKLCWGSDSGTPETIVGIGHVVRSTVADVLEDLIARRVLDVPVALAFLEHLYDKNPRRIYQV